MSDIEMIYGTAWKEGETKDLVIAAVRAGFRAIDTANQKVHYREDYVGGALVELAKEGIAREALFLQSKYTFLRGHDHRVPYDPKATFETQVRDSFQSSLEQLHTDYLDSYILHGPNSGAGLNKADWEVWSTMEALMNEGKSKHIGVSNIHIHQLEELCKKGNIKPYFVQNRCYANQGWDQGVREFCSKNDIVYQGFSLLTANPHVLQNRVTKEIAHKLDATPQQVIFKFCVDIGILPLTGTTNPRHMKEDLDIADIILSAKEQDAIFSIS
ncbi:MAG: diketogulonate reductase-like aldo/keto reductase [Candidatus Omnitrophota bacterium]|jgi:diketogulonate reductase-like aldo/keto reductase